MLSCFFLARLVLGALASTRSLSLILLSLQLLPLPALLGDLSNSSSIGNGRKCFLVFLKISYICFYPVAIRLLRLIFDDTILPWVVMVNLSPHQLTLFEYSFISDFSTLVKIPFLSLLRITIPFLEIGFTWVCFGVAAVVRSSVSCLTVTVNHGTHGTERNRRNRLKS